MRIKNRNNWIVPSNMNVGRLGQERGPQGRELKMGIIHVTIQIVPTDMICRVENVDKRDERDHRDENENGNDLCYNTNCSL